MRNSGSSRESVWSEKKPKAIEMKSVRDMAEKAALGIAIKTTIARANPLPLMNASRLVGFLKAAVTQAMR
jgi:hypothetical protein